MIYCAIYAIIQTYREGAQAKPFRSTLDEINGFGTVTARRDGKQNTGGTHNEHAYFKIKAPSLGNISLTKTTEDGQNLSGWQFGIYADAACTSLIAGPYTTNSSGNLSITGLTAGTYFVKELGHTDRTIHALYTCSSTNPQKVTVTSGGTTLVTFYNKLNTGSVKLIKETNTGKNLSGWQIGLYTDAACTNSVSGSPFTTGADGTVTVSGLQKGTYYAKEISTDDPYWEFDTAVKSVTRPIITL